MKGELKRKLAQNIEKIPYINGPILRFLRISQFYFYRIIFCFKKLKRKEDILKIYWVNPSQINLVSSKRETGGNTSIGSIEGGDWDVESLNKKLELYAVSGLKERFINKKEWKETSYYKKYLEKIARNQNPNRVSNETELQERLRNLDKLFKEIKENGFKVESQGRVDMYSFKKGGVSEEFYSNVIIDIARNGYPLLREGAHRVTIAKLLNLEKIPVIIGTRHREWEKFKQELEKYAELQNGELYQVAYHFDLEHIPYSYGYDRVHVVSKNIKTKSGTLLDIGANFGLFSHELEKIGFKCFVIEQSKSNCYFMNKLKEANQNKFHIINKSIFDYKKGSPLCFDVVLALYIFHHFLKTKQRYEQLKDLLKRIKCSELFLGVHDPKEKAMEGSYLNYDSEEFTQFIVDNSCLTDYELLHEFDNGRKIYRLFK